MKKKVQKTEPRTLPFLCSSEIPCTSQEGSGRDYEG